jgi:hypothetical protein
MGAVILYVAVYWKQFFGTVLAFLLWDLFKTLRQAYQEKKTIKLLTDGSEHETSNSIIKKE